MAEDTEEHSVQTNRGLHDIGRKVLVRFGIENLLFFAREFRVAAQVKISPAVNAFDFFKAKGKFKFNIRSGIRVVCQLVVVVVAVVRGVKAQGQMPAQTGLLPVLVPFHFGSGHDEELHFHLLKFTHAENELARYDFISEGLTDLGNAKRNFHSARLVDVQEVDENALCCFRTQVEVASAFCNRTHFRGKHQVELAHFRPVAASTYGAYNAFIQNDLTYSLQVVGLHGFDKALDYLVRFFEVAHHAWIGASVERSVKGFAKAFGGFFHFLVGLLAQLFSVLFNQYIRTVTLLAVLVVNQRIIEGIDVTTCFPHRGVHKNGRIQPNDIFVQLDHGAPPEILNVIFQEHPVLAIIVDSGKTIVDFTALKNKAIFFGVGNDAFKCFFGRGRHKYCVLKGG